MHPYRDLSTPDVHDEPETRRDDQILAGLMMAIGGLRVLLAIVGAEVFGVEVTVAAVMLAIGTLLMARTFFN